MSATLAPLETERGVDAWDRAPAWLWTASIAFFIAVTAVGAFNRGLFEAVYNGELGLIESAQAVFLAVALILAIVQLARPARRPKGVRLWLGLVVLGLIYTLGEEISYGQHYFGWTTTGWFAQHNDQNETNLHNTAFLLDQAPLLLLQIGVLVGGIIHPVLKTRNGQGLLPRPWWLAPVGWPLPLAVMAYVSMLPEWIDQFRPFPFYTQVFRASEMQELYIYAFMAAYLWVLGRRLHAWGRMERGG